MSDQASILSETLQRNGHRLTPARQAILAALAASGGHISADDLVEQVRHTALRVGRMTVYRTLDLLCELGAIRPVYQGTGAAHYVLLDNGHHHHLVCSNCDRVIEVDECLLPGVAEQLSGQFNFQVLGHVVEFFGLCVDCQ